MKHAAWLVSALALAGLADETDAWVYDTSARPVEMYSVAQSGSGELETRAATVALTRTTESLESRVTSQERSDEGHLDSRPPAGIYLILR